MNTFKRGLLVGVCVMCSLASVSSTPTTNVSAAQATSPSIIVNGTTLYGTVPPYIEKGTTMVPLRAISENLGAQVDWNSETKGITITKNGSKVELTVGNQIGRINGTAKSIAVAPAIVDGSTMVPLRFIGEALSCQVGWEAETKVVTVNTTGTEPEVVSASVDQYGRKIRTTNLPKNANDFPYVVEGVPNWVYEKQDLIRQNNFWSGKHSTWGDGSETNHKGYTAFDLYDGNSNLFPQNLSYGVYEKVDKFLDLQTNVDYKTIDYTWADEMVKLIIPDDLEIFTDGMPAHDYLKTYVDFVKDKKLVSHGEYEILPETLWLDFNNNLHFSVYMKYTLDSATSDTYTPAVGTSALAQTSNFKVKPFEIGKTYEGVITYTLRIANKKELNYDYNDQSKVDYRILYSKAGLVHQIHPACNILDSVAPGTEDPNAPKSFYYVWNATEKDFGKLHNMYEIPKDTRIAY